MSWASDLPPRLQRTLHLVALGWTNQRISEELGVNLHSVENYVAEILDRSPCANRLELIVETIHLKEAGQFEELAP